MFCIGCCEDAPKIFCGGDGSVLRWLGVGLGARIGGVLVPSGCVVGRFETPLGHLGKVVVALEDTFEAVSHSH